MQFVVFTGAYLHQIALEIMLLLLNNFHEKQITEYQERRNFDSARAFYNLHLLYNFALVYMKNALVFSQLDACNFSIYIIRI